VPEEKIASRPLSARHAKITVRFNQQQRKLLDFLRAEGTFGTADGEIIRNVVLQYLEQQKQQSKR
jgi:hypothetical protein